MDHHAHTFEGSLSLYRCYGCTFQILRRPSTVTGHYRLTRIQIQPATPAMP